MKFNKTLIAAALMVAAGSANATLVTGSATGGNEMYMSVYDSAQKKTFNLDLNVTWAQISANAATALTSLEGTGLNLATDTNWASFAAGITSAANVTYGLFTGSVADHSIIVSGNTAMVGYAADPTVLLDTPATFINTHAYEINNGLAGANSSVINDLPATPFIGQLNHLGLNVNGIYGGWAVNPMQAYGLSTSLWLGGFSVTPMDDGLGNIVDTNVFTNADVHNLGSISLTGNTLLFTAAGAPPAAVPLPAAVWMFGAGLMGVLRATRRKSVQA